MSSFAITCSDYKQFNFEKFSTNYFLKQKHEYSVYWENGKTTQ